MASPHEVNPSVAEADRQARLEMIGLGLELVARVQLNPDIHYADGWSATVAPPSLEAPQGAVSFRRGQMGKDYFEKIEIQPEGEGIKTLTTIHSPNPEGHTYEDTFPAKVLPDEEDYSGANRTEVTIMTRIQLEEGALDAIYGAHSFIGRASLAIQTVSADPNSKIPLTRKYDREELKADLEGLRNLQPIPAHQPRWLSRKLGRHAASSLR